MSKFNKRSTGTQTVNRAGGVAYKQSPELALVSLLVTSFVEDQFYRSANETIEELKQLIKQVNPEFAAKAGVFARTEYGMRSISHVLAAEIVREYKGKDWTKNYIAKSIYRPDDAIEMLAYWITTYGKPIPNALKKGIALGLSKFDEYQIAKYKKGKSELSLVDVVNLTHAWSPAIDKLHKGELEAANTWEVKISATEGDEEKKVEAWKELVLEKKIGYFALLRNLRNILETGDDPLITAALELLVDKKLIKKSLVLPFRYQTALTAIQEAGAKRTRDAMIALSQAVDIAVDNVPTFDGDTLVVVDVSGSMSGRPIEIASLFAAALYRKNNADMVVFADSAANLTANPVDSTFTIAEAIRECSRTMRIGGGTNLSSVFKEQPFYQGKEYKRVIVLSDMETWIESSYWYRGDAMKTAFKKWKDHYGIEPMVYTMDLTGSGTMQFPEQNVYALAGFSEKIFDIMQFIEQDRKLLMKKIEATEL